jgi:hypothetical protein
MIMHLWVEWFRCVRMLRPACSRQTTFVKMALVLAGISIRPDLLGVTSIIRTGFFNPAQYRLVLHFFHSRSVSLASLLRAWITMVLQVFRPVTAEGYTVFLADGIKAPKEGRRMPAVKSLHQESANNSKPPYIMGHSFQAIALLVEGLAGHCFAVPLLSRISEGVRFPSEARRSLLDKLATWFLEITDIIKSPALLVADAYYASRKVIVPLLAQGHHLVSRLKSTAVAYLLPVEVLVKRKGRPRIYGDKVRLFNFFSAAEGFIPVNSPVYGEQNVIIRYRSVSLLWRPIGRMVQFVLVMHPSRGNIILLCTSTALDPLTVIKLYGLRFKIEVSFKQALHTLGTYLYHFWMKTMQPLRKGDGDQDLTSHSEKYRRDVERKIGAYHRYVLLGCIAQGLLQHLAINHREAVWGTFRSWLRTMKKDLVPSEFVTAHALRSSLPDFLLSDDHDSLLKKIIIDHAENDKITGLCMAA